MSIYSELLKLAASALHRSTDELSMDIPFEEQGIDSIDLVEILLTVEDRFCFQGTPGDGIYRFPRGEAVSAS